MKFGFIAHPTSIELKRHVKLIDLLNRVQADAEHGYDSAHWQGRDLVPFADFGQIRSASGATCQGLLQYMPATAEEMLAQPRLVAERVIVAVRQMADAGVHLVGLGGFTGIVGNRGISTLEKAGIPTTTGNSLTAYAAWKNVLEVFNQLDLSPEKQEVVVVGYPGSIALVVARLLARVGCRLILVHRATTQDRAKHLNYLPQEMHSQVRLTHDITSCYDKAHVYIAATSTGSVIDPDLLAPGSVVIDAALPRDVILQTRRRNDIIIIDGGLVSASDDFQIGSETMGLSPKKMMNGCLAETMVLALEKRAEPFSIGRELPEEKVIEIGQLAAQHGLTPQRVSSYGEKLDQTDLRALRRFYLSATSSKASRKNVESHLEITIDKDEILRQFGEYINPIMRDFFKMHHIDRVFTSAKNCILIDSENREFLDFVAGYGCLNMGHNHPRIIAALKAYLDGGAPTFVQYVSAPVYASRLAERLCAIAPGGLGRVFFSNSGTEAVEAAIKLARAAANNPRVLYCDNGYHGKTLGALSVTGREKHRRVFAPLLEWCTAIPFADSEALRHELQQGDVGAFILEPIQGEGGVIIPPAGYLSEVRTLCDEYDCILILDEIQTGLGRTGKRFACEWEDVAPDILVLAKSLSGGLVPIGATLTRADLWDKAYGTRDHFALHSSTFGGNNLAAAVALELLDLLDEEELAGNALLVGHSLLADLTELVAVYPFIKAVRGRGLMIAIEFENSFAGGVAAFARELAGRFPGNFIEMYRFLPDQAKHHIEQAIKEVESSFEEMFVLSFVTRLSQDHGILTFVTANNTKVMRIQPPLTLSLEQARYFVECFSIVCEQMANTLD